MKAQNLTVSIPNAGCDKNCPYCVSKMTGYPKWNPDLMERNKHKVLRLAKATQVTSVLFTGKGEPTQELDLLHHWMEPFQEFHTELQTNGTKLDRQVISELYNKGLNVLAFSFDHFDHFEQYAPLAKWARTYGIVTRVTLNVTNVLRDSASFVVTFPNIFAQAKKLGYQQLSLRKITVPNYPLTRGNEAKKAKKWIHDNVRVGHYEELMLQMVQMGGRVIRKLPFGAIVYDIEGVAVTGFDYCIQDTNNNDDIRSLIFMEDGHVYTSWNSKASILF